MSDEYLWDRTGPVDPEIAALERGLAPLRLADPLRAPVHAPIEPRLRPARRTSTFGTMGVAALTAAATAALIWAWVSSTRPQPEATPTSVTIDASVHDPGPVSVGAPAPAIGAPPPGTPVPDDAPDDTSEDASDEASETVRAEPGTAAKPRAKAKPRARAKPATPREEAPTIAPVPSASLPDTPSHTEVRDAIAPLKESARACGRAHRAPAGEKVTIKLSIAGETGRVTSSIALGPHRGTPLGDCVAEVLQRAIFPKFAKESIGVQYPIRVGE